MNIQDYSKQAMSTDVFERTDSISDPGMLEKVFGLVGEAGEVAEKFKKLLRDKGGEATDEDKKEIAKELGDILWYVNSVANYLDYDLEQIATMNLEKVLSRQQRGMTTGSGDNR
ncbi:MAG: nucleoside triphosphate pyrophosphohydrolase family protein [bacterium]|nr:nucleoside triphosphate pyrophosphohydrolase family protein [bacterium]MDN5835447.1 nucleoside triphosphate pyrophosphohydrolase family protein [bacterium]